MYTPKLKLPHRSILLAAMFIAPKLTLADNSNKYWGPVCPGYGWQYEPQFESLLYFVTGVII